MLVGHTRPHFAEHMCQEGISSTVSGSCGKDPPIAHTHLAMVPDAVAERGFKPFVEELAVLVSSPKP